MRQTLTVYNTMNNQCYNNCKVLLFIIEMNLALLITCLFSFNEGKRRRFGLTTIGRNPIELINQDHSITALEALWDRANKQSESLIDYKPKAYVSAYKPKSLTYEGEQRCHLYCRSQPQQQFYLIHQQLR